MSRYAAVHRDSTGPGDGRPTALQIVADEGRLGKLRGAVALVTGCARGNLGFATAQALYANGAEVYVTLRGTRGATELVDDLSRSCCSSHTTGTVSVLPLRLDCLESVRECAQEFQRQSTALHLLILNAGGEKGPCLSIRRYAC